MGEALDAGYMSVNDLGTVRTFRCTDALFGRDCAAKHHATLKSQRSVHRVCAVVETVDSLQTTLSVSDEAMQDRRADRWIYSPADYVWYRAKHMWPLPGDDIKAGSPPAPLPPAIVRFLENHTG
jgi:hypothetical protein